MKIHKVEPGSAEWHSLRKKSIGASDIPVILGLSEYLTPYELWEQKLGFHEVEQTEAMRKGLEIEDEARAWFYEQYGIHVVPTVVSHDEHEWAIASLDGLSVNQELILEIKRVKQEYHEMALCGKVPDIYFAQLQWQMFCTGLENAHYLSYKGALSALVVVPRDNEFIASALREAQEFYECIKNLVPPELTDRDYEFNGEPALQDLLRSYQFNAQQAKIFKQNEERLKEQIKQKLKNKNTRGLGWKMTKYTIPGRIDYDAILSKYCADVDLSQFRKESTTGYRITFT